MFDAQRWAAVPFHFWSGVLFIFGSMVGSFLNVCIHRMPLGESVVSPPSHCPHCKYSIPWYLNMPLITWLWLRGKCANCKAPIAARYFLVELLTGAAFLLCWLAYGRISAGVALVYCVVLAGLIVATAIDFEHFIIPDEITIGGIFAGFAASFLVPALHGATGIPESMKQSFLGAAVGWGLIYAILIAGKLVFGRQKFNFPPGSKIIFTETAIQMPDREVPFEELFYRDSDTVVVQAKSVQIPGRNFENVEVRLSPKTLKIGAETFNPEEVPRMEIITDQIVIPREAMGFGDVKFMSAIGAFLGWQATLFSLMVSSIIGAAVGVGLIALKKHEWSAKLPYGPYIALAAVIYMFGGKVWVWQLFSR